MATLALIFRELEDRPEWFKQAKCLGSCAHRETNLFFADYQHNGQVQAAKSICLGTHPDHPGRCPVIEECLEHALQGGERWGVWGGCSERERRRIKRQRRRAALESIQVQVSITAKATGYQSELTYLARYQQAGDTATWGRAKALIVEGRRLRALKRSASL
jgi:WhiB family redox-sensing transcriptional regulator